MVKVNKNHTFFHFLARTRWIWIVIAFILGITSFLSQKYNYQTIFAKARQSLTYLLRERSQEISKFLQLQQGAITKLANHTKTQELLSHPQLDTNVPLTPPELAYTHLVNQLQKQYHFLKLMLISSNGDVIFRQAFDRKQTLNEERKEESGEDSPSGQANIFSDTAQSTLSGSVLRSQASLTEDWSEFSYDPVSQLPTLFLTRPVFEKGKNIGFLVLQIDHNKLYNIVNNFENLGETGEIILGKAVDHNAIVVAPTRKSKKEGFKTLISLKSKRELPLIYASQDEKGDGFYTDYVNDDVYGVWDFLPIINLGIVVKKNVTEIQSNSFWRMTMVRASYFILVLAIISFLLGVYGLCLGRPPTDKIETTYWHQKALKRFIQALTAIAGLAFIGTLSYQLYHKYSWLNVAEKSETQYLNVAAEQLDHSLTTIANIGHLIAQDLQSGRITYRDLPTRLTRDINENPSILGISIAFKPFAFNMQERLYAPYYYQQAGKIQTSYLDKRVDYTMAGPNLIPWYNLTLPKEGKWSAPFVESITNKNVVVFSVPFYEPQDKAQRTPIGIISIYYPLTALGALVGSYEAGFSGYYLLLSKTGQFLSYPLEEYVIGHKTIFDLAQQLEEVNLIELGRKIKKKEGKVSYKLPNTKETEWIHFKSLSSVNWVLGKVGIEQKVLLTPLRTKLDYEVLFLETVIFSLLIVTLLGRVFTFSVRHIRLTFGLISFVLLFFNASLWFWVYFQEEPISKEDTIISDPVNLSLFLDEQNKKSELLYESKPFRIPTGIYINTLGLSSTENTMAFNAELWQNVNESIPKDIVVGFTFPQASTITITKAHTKPGTSSTSILWNLYAVLSQNLTYKAYPLDAHRLRININPKDTTQNAVLIPSLSSYRYLDPSKRPGIAPEASPGGFYLAKSFFAFHQSTPDVNFGLEKLTTSKELNTLSFNILLKRNILDSLISYVLPLLIILVLLFAVLIVLHSMMERSLPALAALIFTLVLLHHNLRASLGVNEVLYIEYAFFTTYFVHLLVVIYALNLYLFPSLKNSTGIVNNLCVSLFWPLNLLLWLLSTFYVFFWS